MAAPRYTFTVLLLLISLFSPVFIAQRPPPGAIVPTTDDLRRLVATEELVLVNFYEPSCAECEAFYPAYTDLAQELEQTDVVCVSHNGPLPEYGVNSYPRVLFFRKGSPVLFDGALMQEDLSEWVELNRQSNLQHLFEDNFEHLTQASTGATTGDWLVMFSSESCGDCRMAVPVLDAVATKVKGRQNVAVVDVEKNPQLKDRFKVAQVPTIIFFRLGKMYTYSLPKLDIPTMKSFMEGWYKNVRAEAVPGIPTPFDQLVENIADNLKVFVEKVKTEGLVTALTGNLVIMLSVAGLFVIILTVVVCLTCTCKQDQKLKTE
ncbi:PREDICTED: thioredoxin domain-containing protein-like [Branchiostoma belcheri]|uniref:Thioredoxin domain-containing protein-like n=1 Tax=Branchiostoma belcheri TaxID=7741 RepID=A0A6P4YEC2_BRABE|nr:PREDICTED: thioredoxin domain-containing protein-like [Branchiostoma belcheri]